MTSQQYDESIVDLLQRLELDRRAWVIVDHWEADLTAIGLASPTDVRRLVYVSTFGLEPGRYAFESEVGRGEGDESYKVVDSGGDVSFGRLVEALEQHLGAGDGV